MSKNIKNILIIALVTILLIVLTIITKNIMKNNKFMTENRTLNGKKASYCNPVIPKGFRISKKGASWKYVDDKIEGWNDGLVIEDELENEFVWIPVKDGIGQDGEYTENEKLIYKKWYNISNAQEMDNETLKEIKTILGKESLDSKIQEEQIIEDSLPNGVISEYSQIEKYEGFYIARYEAGINKDNLKELYNLEDGYNFITVDNRNNTDKYIPVSQKDSQIWNFIEYSNAKKVAENMYKDDGIKSGLMTGRQFDTIMRWAVLCGYNLEDTTTWGNFLDTHSNKYSGRYASYLRKESQDWQIHGYGDKNNDKVIFTSAGGLEIAKMNNIYDIAGNVIEFTTDLYEGNISLVRGGSAAYSGKKDSPHTAISFSFGDAMHYVIGFRVVLYLE